MAVSLWKIIFKIVTCSWVVVWYIKVSLDPGISIWRRFADSKTRIKMASCDTNLMGLWCQLAMKSWVEEILRVLEMVHSLADFPLNGHVEGDLWQLASCHLLRKEGAYFSASFETIIIKFWPLEAEIKYNMCTFRSRFSLKNVGWCLR